MSFGHVEKGFSPSTEDLKKINKYTRREFDADSLYVFTVILCDNDIDRDFEKFSLSALNELKTLFVGKTGISDHSMKSSDQKARVFETWIEKGNGTTTADGEPYYMLKAKAYMLKNEENKGFIDELDAGIKKEVSVSCSSKKATCSICGTDKRQCRCEHVSGKEYKGKTACTILSDISDAYEFSFVAVPAQRQAGVTKAFEFTKENNMEDIIKTLKNMSDDTTVSKFQLDSLLNYVDSLEDEAELGRKYKKSLANEVIKLCAEAMPEMDIKAFSSVAQVMTAKELLSFKEAFTKKNRESTAHLQIKSNDTKTNNTVNQFKL